MSLYVRVEKHIEVKLWKEEAILDTITYYNEEPSEEEVASLCLQETHESGIEVDRVTFDVSYHPIYSNTEDHW